MRNLNISAFYLSSFYIFRMQNLGKSWAKEIGDLINKTLSFDNIVGVPNLGAWPRFTVHWAGNERINSMDLSWKVESEKVASLSTSGKSFYVVLIENLWIYSRQDSGFIRFEESGLIRSFKQKITVLVQSQDLIV